MGLTAKPTGKFRGMLQKIKNEDTKRENELKKSLKKVTR